MLVEDGLLVDRDGRLEPLAAVDTLRVPGTVQAVLAARLDRLEPDELAVLQRASVMGQVFLWGAVAELTPAGQEGDVARSLQALVRKQLIRPDRRTIPGEDGFRFGHILIRDAAYESLPKGSRADLHERFAGWVERRAVERTDLDEIIGYHLEQAFRLRLSSAATATRRSSSRAGRPTGSSVQAVARSRAATSTRRGACSSALPRSCRRTTSAGSGWRRSSASC